MLFPFDEIEALRAGAKATSPLVAITNVDPVDFVRSGAELFARANLMHGPDGTVVAGLGAASVATSRGERRFASLQGMVPSDEDAAPVFAGFSFAADGPTSAEWDGFEAAELVAPQLAIVERDGLRRLFVNPGSSGSTLDLLDTLAILEQPLPAPPFEPGNHTVESHPTSSEWRTEVEEAVSAIGQGSLSKVVLSRSVDVTTEHSPRPFDLVDHLRRTYPQCFVFVWQNGHASFIGASPELLLSTRGDAIRLNPLAGSARRGEGEADDRAMGEALMHSAKDRQEHSLVVEDIVARLRPHVQDMQIPSQPSLRRMATVQHLSTEIAANVGDGISALDLVAVVHPTPAVGGTPRDEALAFLDKVEGIDRGWYTGGIGWLFPNGDSTFAIPLRCALIRASTARLYAGAGIVAESDPERELSETRLKFRPMLSLLTAT